MNSETGLSGEHKQAVFAVGDWVFGVQARQVVQVVPRPTNMTHLPRAGSRLASVLPFRQHAVPVIDLRSWHQPEALQDRKVACRDAVFVDEVQEAVDAVLGNGDGGAGNPCLNGQRYAQGGGEYVRC